MAPPDTEALQEAPEDVMRRVAREEARAVYDEYTVTDEDGKQWTFPEVVDTISELEGGATRRTFAKAAMAMAYIAAGGAGTTAILRAASQPVAADASGESGTQADPLTNLWAHNVNAGDGADVITLGDAIQHANEAVSSATTIGNVCYIEVDTSIAGFTVTIPASLEKSGIELRFVDNGGSAGSKSFDVTSTNWNIDGAATATVDVSDTAFVLYSAGDRWVSHRFIQRLDAGTIATGALNFVQGSQSPGWELLFTDEDTDETTVYSADTGTITSFDVFKVWGYIAGHGSSAAGDLKITINNDTTANYRWNHIDKGTLGETTGANAWIDELFQTDAYQVGYIIRGKDPLAASGNQVPGIQSIAAGDTDRNHLMNGKLNSNISSDITRIKLETSYNARGRMGVYGIDIR